MHEAALEYSYPRNTTELTFSSTFTVCGYHWNASSLRRHVTDLGNQSDTGRCNCSEILAAHIVRHCDTGYCCKHFARPGFHTSTQGILQSNMRRHFTEISKLAISKWPVLFVIYLLANHILYAIAALHIFNEDCCATYLLTLHFGLIHFTSVSAR